MCCDISLLERFDFVCKICFYRKLNVCYDDISESKVETDLIPVSQRHLKAKMITKSILRTFLSL